MAIQTSELLIRFPKRIKSSSIEETLRKYYRKSCSEKNTTVRFDLTPCEWCEIFSLSLISLWIWQLKSQGKQITIIFPVDPDVHRFLVSYRFKEFLEDILVKIVQTDLHSGHVRAREAVAPSYPLTFVSEQSFRTLLADLKDPNRLSVLLSGMEESEIVKSGAFRSVLLKELGDNVFLHGDGKAGHLMMTKISKLPLDAPKRHANKLEKLIYNSLKRIAGKSVLEIVIGDKGPGIAKSLRSQYTRENNISDAATVAECDLIEFAFLFHTSRRSTEERLGEFLNHFVKGSSLPPTGLYQLRELVRDYHGVLCIRSGASFIIYDFPTDSQPTVARSDKGLGSSSLCDFGGVQYRILIPTDQVPRPESTADATVIAKRLASVSAVDQELVTITDFIDLRRCGDLDQEGRGIFKLLEAIDHAGVSNDAHKNLVIVDFEAAEDLSAKSMYFILLELSRRQSLEKAILAINVNPISLSTLQYEKHLGRQLHSPNTVVFDIHAVPSAFWVSSDMRRLIGCPLVIGRSTDLTGDQVTDRSSLLAIPRNAIQNSLTIHVLTPESGIFREDAKVLLLSDGYSLGYFEISKLFRNEQSRSRIVLWFVYQLMELEPELIVSLGTTLGGIIDAAKNTFLRQSKVHQIQHINLRTDSRGRVSLPRLLLVEPGKKVLVAGDVVGTARSILATLKMLRHTEVQRVVTVVDARENGERDSYAIGSDLELTSIVRKPLTYFHELPNDWLYHEIFQVDPDTHVLVKEIVRPLGSLWIEREADSKVDLHKQNYFLEKIIIPERAFFSGHFVTGKKHMTYMFDVSTIAANHEAEIVTAIATDIRNAENTKTSSDKMPVDRVIFPQFNRGLDQIAKKVASKYQETTTLAIPGTQLRSIFDQQSGELKDKCVIVLDDATDSGETMLRLIDISERMGATRIYGYVLINRGAAYAVRRLEKLKQYGFASIHIRYLAEAQLPSYVIETCPLCHRRQRLERLAQRVGRESKFSGYIKEVIESFAEQPASAVRPEPSQQAKGAVHQTIDGNKLALRCLLAEAEVYPAIYYTQVLGSGQQYRSRRKKSWTQRMRFDSLIRVAACDAEYEATWRTGRE